MFIPYSAPFDRGADFHCIVDTRMCGMELERHLGRVRGPRGGALRDLLQSD